MKVEAEKINEHVLVTVCLYPNEVEMLSKRLSSKVEDLFSKFVSKQDKAYWLYRMVQELELENVAQ